MRKEEQQERIDKDEVDPVGISSPLITIFVILVFFMGFYSCLSDGPELKDMNGKNEISIKYTEEEIPDDSAVK